MAPGFLVVPTFEIFRGGSMVRVCNSDAGRFEGTVWVCREEDEEACFVFSFWSWGWDLDAYMGMFKAAGSVGAS